MDNLIEKILTFIIVCSFLVISYALLNINKIEYSVKTEKMLNDNSVFVFEKPISNWLTEHTLCEDFGILRRDDYAITECLLDDGTVEYLKDYVKKSNKIYGEYLFLYNKEKQSFNIYSEDDNINKVENDFYDLLGVEFIKEDNMKPETRFKMIERNKKAKFFMIKKDEN